MHVSEFLRLYAMRAPNLMWLLGAGSSVTSGIAGAGEMIWDFKRTLYCTEQKVSLRACPDLSDPLLQQKLQYYFDSTGKYPTKGADSEYADYFTAVYPDEADRRRYIDRAVSRATPSYRRKNLNVLAVNPKNLDNPKYEVLRTALGQLAGTIPRIGIWWSEAINIRLELRLNRLWLLIEPSIWVDNLPGRRVPDEVKEFHRNRSAKRYNNKWNSLVESWSSVLTDGRISDKITALGVSDGIDAAFEIHRTTAFSRRAKSS